VVGALILGALFLPCGTPASGGARGGDFFTIAVLPDTQNYVDHTKAQPESFEAFKAQVRYLARHRRDLQLAFVTHVGDVVQHGDGTNGSPGDASYGAGLEWTRAQQAMDILEESGVPFGMSIGNHDYDNQSYTAGRQPLESHVMWRRYFGSRSALFDGKPWYGGASDGLAHDPGLSSFQTFSAGGKWFLHIALELEAGDEALAWAQHVIDSHEGYATIITTHEYINPPAQEDDASPLRVPAERVPATPGYRKGSPAGWNDAQGVWDKLISKNDQIFMVICGHAWRPAIAGVSKSENLRIDENDAGHPVYQLLTDYQGNTLGSSGGDGWLRLMRFDLHRKVIHFSTYSPALRRHAGRDGERTFGQAPEFSDFTLPMPAQVFRARSGSPDGDRRN
jgi:hypothetical protein